MAMPACEEIDGEDEEIVMTVLGSLEDLLYEPISIGGGDSSDSSDDDAWNSCESKEGHSLRDEIATFADRAMAADDDAGDGEYPLVWTELHQAFKTLVEGHVQGVLERQRHTPQSFVRLVETIEKREGWTWARDGCREVVSLLREVDDFETWARELRRKAAARRERARHK